jgi:iron complex outermembrane receptor protein
VTDDLPLGQLQFGLWLDRNNDNRFSENIDLTQGGTQGNVPVVGKYGTAYTYELTDTLTTIEPYVELDWKVTPDLTVTPGVRFSDFQRSIDALYNKTKPPVATESSATYSATQPSVSARYTIRPGWTAYAQAASGFLAPPINVVEVAGSPAAVNPEQTWNYQAGTNFKHGRWILGADVYYIDFTNYISSATVGGVASYTNGGGAIYEGAEFEGQYVLDHGFSLYGNATYNSAKYTGTSVWLAEAPQATAAAGLLYDDRRGPYASIIAKWIGARYGLDTPLSGAAGHVDSFGLDPFVTADLAAGWRFRNPLSDVQDVTVSIKVSNLFDNRVIDDYAGQQSATSTAFPYGAPLYWTVAGRSAFLNVSASF